MAGVCRNPRTQEQILKVLSPGRREAPSPGDFDQTGNALQFNRHGRNTSGHDSKMPSLTAPDIIRLLDLKPHPEGGHFCETFRDVRQVNGRAISTAIYFLLARGERSRWHRVDAVEIWHWYAGAPLMLQIAADKGSAEQLTLGIDLGSGQRPQAVVPAHAWQAAQSLGDWTLVGCTVSPGFEFSRFELAPGDWSPG